MKCRKCGNSWTVENNIPNAITKCPSCGYVFRENETIGRVIKELLKENGLEILKNSERINAILADYFPDKKKETKSIKSALEVGIGFTFYEIAKGTQDDVSEKIMTIKRKLIDEAWLSDTACAYICTVFLGAINFSEKKKNKSSPKCKNILNKNMKKAYKKGIKLMENNNLKDAVIMLEAVMDNGEYEELANLKLAEIHRKSPELCVKYYTRAAELENSEAQYNLGALYYMGYGVVKDLKKAYELFSAAAQQGNLTAQYNLGVMYEYGKGVNVDLEQAIWWYEKAGDNGSEDARTNCERLKKMLHS